MAEELRARFSGGSQMRVSVPVAKIVSSPGNPARQREAVCGARIAILETKDGMAFGQSALNGYVGYFAEDDLAPWHRPTHQVIERTTLAFSRPDFRDPQAIWYSFGSRVTITGQTGRFLESDDGLFFPDNHLVPVGTVFDDPVSVARLFLGTPYLWGGNSGFGIDCSGLVQAALNACGWACPGDSGEQAGMPGVSVKLGETKAGDLVFWDGHVAIDSGAGTLVHANESNMKVTEEPHQVVISRNLANGTGPVTHALRPERISLPSE